MTLLNRRESVSIEGQFPIFDIKNEDSPRATHP
jgi:hypothetical protein